MSDRPRSVFVASADARLVRRAARPLLLDAVDVVLAVAIGELLGVPWAVTLWLLDRAVYIAACVASTGAH